MIRIPKNIYEDLFNKELQDWFIESEVNFYGLKIGKAIQNGTVLPKGHGDLKDVQDIINRINLNYNNHQSIDAYSLKDMIDTIPTIIKADEDGQDGR